MKKELTHGSLFSGIGGFELGAEFTGIKTLWNCEIEYYQRMILSKRFPGVKQYYGIRPLRNAERVSIISGGFPCQDISIAGKGEGIKGSRSGLWSEMFRVCGLLRPEYIIIENSSAITFRGLEQVLCDLSEIGYNAEWQSLSGYTFGLQHDRERIYIIAYSSQISSECSSTQQVFRQFNIQREFARIYPGWRTRRDIPEPRTYRSSNDIPYLLDRIESLGNAVMPLIAFYLFECVKLHYEDLT
jgi:DNA (cytosine-5)-methyltransferase 1